MSQKFLEKFSFSVSSLTRHNDEMLPTVLVRLQKLPSPIVFQIVQRTWRTAWYKWNSWCVPLSLSDWNKQQKLMNWFPISTAPIRVASESEAKNRKSLELSTVRWTRNDLVSPPAFLSCKCLSHTLWYYDTPLLLIEATGHKLKQCHYYRSCTIYFGMVYKNHNKTTTTTTTTKRRQLLYMRFVLNFSPQMTSPWPQIVLSEKSPGYYAK